MRLPGRYAIGAVADLAAGDRQLVTVTESPPRSGPAPSPLPGEIRGRVIGLARAELAAASAARYVARDRPRLRLAGDAALARAGLPGQLPKGTAQPRYWFDRYPITGYCMIGYWLPA